MAADDEKIVNISKSVVGKGAAGSDRRIREGRAAEQLSLPLYRDRELIVLPLDDLRKDAFISALRNMAPLIVVDMRYVPRFDFGTDSGHGAFQFVERTAAYIPHPVPFHKLIGPSGSEGLQEAVEAAVQRLQQSRLYLKGPIMVLVDSPRHGRLVGPLWQALLRAETNSEWDVTLG